MHPPLVARWPMQRVLLLFIPDKGFVVLKHEPVVGLHQNLITPFMYGIPKEVELIDQATWVHSFKLTVDWLEYILGLLLTRSDILFWMPPCTNHA